MTAEFLKIVKIYGKAPGERFLPEPFVWLYGKIGKKRKKFFKDFLYRGKEKHKNTFFSFGYRAGMVQ